MDFGVNYKLQRISGCCFNTIFGFDTTRTNQLKMLFATNELDHVFAGLHYKNNVFSGVQYFLNYVKDQNKAKVRIGRIASDINNERYITVKLFIHYKLVKAADELDSDTFVAFHEILLLDAIIAASKKYKIPEENYKELLERRAKLGTIPEWIPEMEDNPQLVIDMYKASVPG